MKIIRIFTLLIFSFSSILLCAQTGVNDPNKTNQTKTNTPGTVRKPGQQKPGQSHVKKASTGKKNTQNSADKAMKNYTKGELGKPVSAAKEITDPNEKKANELLSSASTKGRQGDYHGALNDYTQALSLFKASGTYMKRGYTNILLENYPAALSDLNEALRMEPGSPKVLFSRGVCKFEMQDFKGAGEDLKASIAKDSSNAIAFNYMAGVCFMTRDYKCALENYNMVVKIVENFPDVYSNRGMMRHYLGDLKGAIEDYNIAIKQSPENPNAYNNRGAAKLGLNEYKESLEDFDMAIKLKDDYSDAYNNRGKARMNLGDKTGACEDWHKSYYLGLEDSMQLIIKYCK